ncbi:MAG: hypothetical protein AAF806_14415 [Bacteroidota bacterium]
MASPIQSGTFTASPFINQYVNILNEEIKITLNDDFSEAEFEVVYQIEALKDGIQIPLLFYALYYKDQFQIWVDDEPVAFEEVWSSDYSLTDSTFIDFDYLFAVDSNGYSKQILIEEDSISGFYITLNDLKFFETDLAKGEHFIKVVYTASKWADYSDWVQQHSFRYALAPAKYWKSFNSLKIVLDASKCDFTLATNLGAPQKGNIKTVAEWNFDGLPSEYIFLKYQVKTPTLSKILLAISPLGMTVIFGLFLTGLHIFGIKKYRLRRPNAKPSVVVILGSLVVPFLILSFHILSYFIIDWSIGEEASGRHGYMFLVIFLYPLLLPIYWIMMWFIDEKVKMLIAA